MSRLPTSVGRYRVIAKLGQGGMATALLALSEGPGGFRKLSVVKQLRQDLCEDPDFIAMFLDEARIAALLNHPNVVQTNEVGEEGGVRFISMEYLQGQSLARVLHRVQGRLPLGMHLRVISEALTGLHYVHELADLSGHPLSVVHRDISPGNLFLTYDGEVKVLDFGIAKARGGSDLTQAGTFKGKMAYVAPEQARAKVVDRRADVFAMGVLLWEALAKRPLVDRSEDEALTLHNRVKGLEPSIDEVAPDASKALRDVCKRAMALDPNNRFASAKAYRDALEAAAEGIGGRNREELATVMGKLFEKERANIKATIARTISSDAAFESPEALRSEWQASTSLAMNPVVYNEARTMELTMGSLSQVESTALPIARRSSSYGTAAVLVVSLALLIGVAAYFMDAPTSPSTAAVAAPEASTPDASSEAITEDRPEVKPLPPSEIQLAIVVQPSSATLTLDGQALGANPYEGSQKRSDQDIELVASAPGYETSRRVLRLQRDLALQFSLTKLEDPVDQASVTNAATKSSRPKAGKVAKDTKSASVSPAVDSNAGKDSDSAKDKGKGKGKRPRPGDALAPKVDTTKRPIDKDNPYQ